MEAAAAQTERPAPRGLAGRVAAAWRGGFRPAMARELAAEPGEARLLAYAMGGCAMLFLARLPQTLEASAQGGLEPGSAVTLNLVSMLFFTPLFLYAVAALARLGLKAFGGTGGWRETRAAMFWSLILAAPAILAGGALGALAASAGAPAWAAALPAQAAGLAWLWIWSVGLAEAHRLRAAWPIFALVAALAAALILLAPAGPAAG